MLMFKWFWNLNWLLNYLKFEYLIINNEITQLNIELYKRKGIEYKSNRNRTLLILHNLYNVFTLRKNWKEDYIIEMNE
jgi:hypothetical protein